MKRKNFSPFIVICGLFSILAIAKANGQSVKSNDYLLLDTDTCNGQSSYKDINGNIIISADKYTDCFTDTFKTYAIVLKSSYGFVAINRQEKVLYKVFPFDNGPDDPSEGFFRIIDSATAKIGYADSVTGLVVIKPQFGCAWPFENGVAKVSLKCKTIPDNDGEHSFWVSDHWYYINKQGHKVKPPKDEE